MQIDFHQGYKQALIDLTGWMYRPGRNIDKQLLHPKRFREVLHHIIDNIDDFMDCPDLFAFEFEITKNGVYIKDGHVRERSQLMKRGTCRGCGAPIVWIETTAGKSMPCDAKAVHYWEKPKAAGKVVTPNGEVLSCEFEGDLQNATGIGYISHFSTCPKAGQFRKK